MALWEIAVIALAVLAVCWTLAVIPLLLVLRRGARRVDGLLREAELHLGPILAEARDTARHLNKASAGVADGVTQAGRAFEAVGEFGRTIQGANTLLRAALGPSLAMLAGTVAGLRAAGRVLWRRLFARR